MTRSQACLVYVVNKRFHKRQIAASENKIAISPKYLDKEGFPSIPLCSEQKHKEKEENFIEEEAQNAIKKLKERKQKETKQKQYSPSLKNTSSSSSREDGRKLQA